MDQQSLALPPDIGESVARALDEDIGKGDLTAALISEDAAAAAFVASERRPQDTARTRVHGHRPHVLSDGAISTW